MSVRSVVVRPPSAVEETITVVRAGVAIAVIALLAIQSESSSRAKPGTNELFAFQKLFRDQPSQDQRTYRQLQEGLLEAERIRAETGKWPDATRLADDGVPPFTFDPIDRDAYTWSARIGSNGVNYLGVPKQGRKLFMLFIQEPGESAQDPTGKKVALDEFHHELPGGILIHVGTWTRANAERLPEGVIDRPLEFGFDQIILGQEKQK